MSVLFLEVMIKMAKLVVYNERPIVAGSLVTLEFQVTI